VRYAAALAVSLCVHLIGFGLVRAVRSEVVLRVPLSPQTVDIEVADGAAALPLPVPLHADAPLPPRRERRKMAAPLPSVAPAARIGIAVPEAPRAGLPTAGPPQDEALSGVSPAGSASPEGDRPPATQLDLRPFFQRLQAAAHRCAGTREGEARVRFCVDPAGNPTQISLVQSSGNFALDDAALHCVIPGAAPLPLTDRCLVVPLVFR
jgi:TonB family protein